MKRKFDYLIKTCEHRSIKQLQQHACRLYKNINLVFSVDKHTRKLNLISYQQFVCLNKDNINPTRWKPTV